MSVLPFDLPLRDLYANRCLLNHSHVHSIPSTFSNNNTTSSLCSSKHSERFAFPLSLRGTSLPRCFPLTQALLLLETDAEVIPTLLIKLVIGETGASEHWPRWMRVLAMDIIRRAGKASPLYLIAGMAY